MLDYIIIGDGIAGLFLYHFLKKKGKQLRIIGHKSPYTASTASTGIINPITGRSYAMTWMAEELLTFSDRFYTVLGRILGIDIHQPTSIYREFEDMRSQNNWANRSAEPGYEGYYSKSPKALDSALFKDVKSGMEISRAFWVNVTQLVMHYRASIAESSDYLVDTFYHDDMNTMKDAVSWNGLTARRIVFAEGYTVHKNPWFRSLPFQYALGYTMVIEAENLALDRIVKKGIFLIPLGENRYQIGSTFLRNTIESDSDEAQLAILKSKLEAAIAVPYTVLSHRKGVRTVVKDRRPILGASEEHSNVFIYNGLGTKGYSLGPYFAAHMAEYLEAGTSLIPEVDIRRFH